MNHRVLHCFLWWSLRAAASVVDKFRNMSHRWPIVFPCLFRRDFQRLTFASSSNSTRRNCFEWNSSSLLFCTVFFLFCGDNTCSLALLNLLMTSSLFHDAVQCKHDENVCNWQGSPEANTALSQKTLRDYVNSRGQGYPVSPCRSRVLYRLSMYYNTLVLPLMFYSTSLSSAALVPLSVHWPISSCRSRVAELGCILANPFSSTCQTHSCWTERVRQNAPSVTISSQ